jgi:hypothetical protein
MRDHGAIVVTLNHSLKRPVMGASENKNLSRDQGWQIEHGSMLGPGR